MAALAPTGMFAGVHTVDSFQGNQADVVAVSLVRNNTEGPGRGMGFLDESSRINVLLSRAERLLVLLGSWDFFRYQISTVELDDPRILSGTGKQIVTLLEQWFTSGRALRVPADAGSAGSAMIVLIPVSRFRVAYEIARGRPYSRLERRVLEAIADGGATLHALTTTFKVHERLLIESVVTLVNVGWVAVTGGAEATFVLTVLKARRQSMPARIQCQ